MRTIFERVPPFFRVPRNFGIEISLIRSPSVLSLQEITYAFQNLFSSIQKQQIRNRTCESIHRLQFCCDSVVAQNFHSQNYNRIWICNRMKICCKPVVNLLQNLSLLLQSPPLVTSLIAAWLRCWYQGLKLPEYIVFILDFYGDLYLIFLDFGHPDRFFALHHDLTITYR